MQTISSQEWLTRLEHSSLLLTITILLLQRNQKPDFLHRLMQVVERVDLESRLCQDQEKPREEFSRRFLKYVPLKQTYYSKHVNKSCINVRKDSGSSPLRSTNVVKYNLQMWWKQVDTPDLGSGAYRRTGSIPVICTNGEVEMLVIIASIGQFRHF